MSFDLNAIYKERRRKVCSYLKEHNLAAVVFEDSESCRDVSIRYLTGHPGDAVLVLTAKGTATLCPWDENLAKEKAHIENIVPYTNFERTNTKAVCGILQSDGTSLGKVALSPATSHILFEKYSASLKDYEVECKEGSAHEYVSSLRAVKDEYEIACTKKAAAITDAMTVYIAENVKNGKLQNETDVALYIERELRAQGCEKTSFDTLAAGPSRSFAIHAFPGYTNGSWGTQGLSILDYGVCYEGYASDCTITIAKGPLSKEQGNLLDLVQKAADECLKLYLPGKPLHDASAMADTIFAQAGLTMPHSLGHGTGLEIHEAPYVSMRTPMDKLFMPGNIVTLEPGLYSPTLGGTRLENDVLITESGNEVLTHSKIFRI